ncbi:MAG TPA: ATPase domain-containing protein [Thermoanaerobaculia bacterium]|nr:ATPase domain-containing protein [Thermoanaerobaculia bacterium]
MVDVRNTPALSAALSQVFLLAEKINVQAFHWARRSALSSAKDVEPPQWPGLLPLISDVGDRVVRSGWGWGRHSPVPDLFRRADLYPDIDPRVIRSAMDQLLATAPQVSSVIEELWEAARFYPVLAARSIATVPLGLKREPAEEIPIHYYEEPLDSIGVVQQFLEKVLGEEGRAVDHYLQLWLRSTFGLEYDKETKYSITRICERLNLLFYGSAVPSSQEIHTQRPATLGVRLLVSEILRLLERLPGGKDSDDLPTWEEVDQRRLRQAIGIYLFIRFCRQLRSRYYWPSSDPVAEDSELPIECQCATPLRPMAYTYFQARVFGRISTVPGLTNIFRGGLLSRTNCGSTVTMIGPPGSGKTVLALQLMADVARFGGLAIYFSFEESYDSIVDRLVTFRLYDPEKFQVEQAGADLSEVVRKVHRRDPLKGLLVLFNPAGFEPFPLVETLQAISESTSPFFEERAVAIDSVSALSLRAAEGQAEAFGRRLNLHSLIDAFETSNFLGLLLGEEGDANAATLAYLTDTVLRFSFDEVIHTRWIEVTKCRLQDYQSGRHPFRMADGRGIVIYPSLVSRRSSLRRRVKSTLSEHRFIPLPVGWHESLKLYGINEKASVLLWGPPGGGKTLLLLNLLTLPNKQREEVRSAHKSGNLGPPRSVLLITFRTTEINFLQSLRQRTGLMRTWERIVRRRVRWYSPGENITGDQVVSEIWKYIKQSRREGAPVERIAFDETETAEEFLPSLRREPLFWPTLLELTSTEAMTSFFVFGGNSGSRLIEVLRSSVDYAFRVDPGQDSSSPRIIEAEKQPSLDPTGKNRTTFCVLDDGTIG